MHQARYGSAVASYFHFYRWLVGTYICIASLSLVWVVFHILKQINQGRSTLFSATLVGIIPSFLAYSSFDPTNRNLYAVMVVLTTAVQVLSATVKWIREDKVRPSRAGSSIASSQPAIRPLGFFGRQSCRGDSGVSVASYASFP